MNRKTSLVVLAGATLGLGGVTVAQTADTTRAYSNEVLSDAKGRTSLAAADSTVTVFGQAQFRYDINSRDNAAPDEDATIGFTARRTKIGVKGDVAEGWHYYVLGEFSRSGGGFVLDQAYGTYDINENWTAKFGQFKLPVLKEESISSSRQLAADRSATNETFNQDRSQGIQFGYNESQWRFMGAFSDGASTRSTDFNSSSEADYAFTARGEWMYAGDDWGRFDDFTSWRNSEYAGVVGAAFHYQGGGDTGGPTSDIDAWILTIDAQAEGNGWNAYGAFVWANTDPATGDSMDDLGVVLQGGYFFNDSWEGFLRWDSVFPDDRTGGNDSEFNTITVGVNNYIIPESHAAKFTLQLQYFLDATTDSIVGANTGIGLLSSSEDSQFDVTAQFQWLF